MAKPVEPIKNALTQLNERSRVAAAHAPPEEPPGAREEPGTTEMLAPPQSVLSPDEAEEALDSLFKPVAEQPKNRTGTLRAPQRRLRDNKDTIKLSFVLTKDVNELLRRVMLGFPAHLHRNEVVNKVLEAGLRDIEIRQQRRALGRTG